MNIPRFNKLRVKVRNWIYPANPQRAIYGVDNVSQDKSGRIYVKYLDGRELQAPSDKDIVTEFDGIGPILRFVEERSHL